LIDTLTPQHWKQYQLIDTGGFEKLEKFGNFILARPEPQAIWDKTLSEEEWKKKANANFKKDFQNPDKGIWSHGKDLPQHWIMEYNAEVSLKFKISLSSFKHVGIFPEQAANWDYIYQKVKALNMPKPKFLNLFAYTGGASLAAAKAGADVTHVDSIKQVITWANDNKELNQIPDIRWVVDDAMKFAKREIKRGNKYNGIILDPPAYGRGPDGEKWILEQNILELLKMCNQLLDPDNRFLILNIYSLGFSAMIVDNLMNNCIDNITNRQVGELYLEDSFNKKLPLGIYYRFTS